MQTALLDTLNEQQLEIATADPCDMFVVAGAGTGKTKVLISRVAYLVSAQECKPWQILAVTFTNKAAKEMRVRLCDALGWSSEEAQSLLVTTFHGMCNKILHRHYLEAGLTRDFSIITGSDQKALLKRLYTQYGIKSCDDYGDLKELGLDIRQVLFSINNDKQQDKAPKYAGDQLNQIREHFADTWKKCSDTELYEVLYSCYTQECEISGVLDFNDLLNRTKKLLTENSMVRHFYQRRFKYLFIDEFQDTNQVQYDLIMKLKCPSNSIMVVGDDDQSIYSWRGAEVKNLQHIERDIPNIQRKELSINYRSSQNILTFANALISFNENRLVDKFLTAPDIYEQLSKYDIDLLSTLPFETVRKSLDFLAEDDPHIQSQCELINSADDLDSLTPSLRRLLIDDLLYKKVISPDQSEERERYRWQAQQSDDKSLVTIVRAIDDASFVKRAMEILKDHGCTYNDMAVLYRNNSLSQSIETMLVENNIPYQVYGGNKFYERPEIVLVLCYLRLMVNPKDDVAFDQIINVPSRTMGEMYQAKIKSFAKSCGMSCYEAISSLIQSGSPMAIKDFKKTIPFYELIESLKADMFTATLPEIISSVVKKAGLDAYFMKQDSKESSARLGVSRMDNINQLIANAAIIQNNPEQNLNELAQNIEDDFIDDEGTFSPNYEDYLNTAQSTASAATAVPVQKSEPAQEANHADAAQAAKQAGDTQAAKQVDAALAEVAVQKSPRLTDFPAAIHHEYVSQIDHPVICTRMQELFSVCESATMFSSIEDKINEVKQSYERTLQNDLSSPLFDLSGSDLDLIIAELYRLKKNPIVTLTSFSTRMEDLSAIDFSKIEDSDFKNFVIVAHILKDAAASLNKAKSEAPSLPVVQTADRALTDASQKTKQADAAPAAKQVVSEQPAKQANATQAAKFSAQAVVEQPIELPQDEDEADPFELDEEFVEENDLDLETISPWADLSEISDEEQRDFVFRLMVASLKPRNFKAVEKKILEYQKDFLAKAQEYIIQNECSFTSDDKHAFVVGQSEYLRDHSLKDWIEEVGIGRALTNAEPDLIETPKLLDLVLIAPSLNSALDNLDDYKASMADEAEDDVDESDESEAMDESASTTASVTASDADADAEASAQEDESFSAQEDGSAKAKASQPVTQRDILLNFIAGAALVSSAESNEKGEDHPSQKDGISLMTIHASKGLEFKGVICVGFEQGILPSAFAEDNGNYDEERRLAYVAVTRAKEHLLIGFCKERMRYGQYDADIQASDFLNESVHLLKSKGAKPYTIRQVSTRR